MLVIITGLAAEARLLTKLGCLVLAGGGTTQGALRQAEAALARGATTLISFGLAGGLSPGFSAGTLVLPQQVLWHDRAFGADTTLNAALGGSTCEALVASDAIVATSVEKIALHRATGADATDMESGVVAELAARNNTPFAVLRAVCDPAGRDLPAAALAALNAAGTIGFARVAGSVIRQPGQIATLLALARDAQRARKTLIDRVAHIAASAALLPWTSALPEGG